MGLLRSFAAALTSDDARPWTRDPLLWIALACTTAVTAHALAASRYLPLIDYSNHLGLISVLAHGAETGALDYLVATWAPTPYLLFYAITAMVAQVVPVDIAGQVTLTLAALLLGVGAASLADATGRSPRLGALAPLAMFGVSYGYGFVTFVFTAPILLWALATTERLVVAERGHALGAGTRYGLAVALTYLGHGLLFWSLALLLGLRVLVVGLAQVAHDRAALRHVGRTVTRLGLGALPACALALPSIVHHLRHPDIEAGVAPPTSLFSFEPWSSHVQQLGGHLLERGSTDHWTVMYAVAALFLVLLAAALFVPRTTDVARESRWALVVYATAVVAMFLVGPMSLEWPSSVWYVYPRYGVIAAALVWLLPRVRLAGAFGVVVVLTSVGLVTWNAGLNRQHIARFDEWASQYDAVRDVVPPRTRVLALTVAPGGDLSHNHPALGSLYFYHLVDGATYTAFLLDKTAHPVHSRRDVPQPRAPFWREPHSFDPRVHGVDFDYLVLRGPALVARTREAGLHELVAEINGWVVFKTKAPTPRPGERPAG